MSGRSTSTRTPPAVGPIRQSGTGARSPAGADVRLGAKALVRSNGRVLLIEERHADGTPFWTLPGGGTHAAETFVDCLRREMAEELQCGIDVTDFAGLCRYAHRSRHGTTLYALFRGNLRSTPLPAPSEGVFDAAWVRPSDPPPNLPSPFDRLLESVAGEPAGD